MTPETKKPSTNKRNQRKAKRRVAVVRKNARREKKLKEVWMRKAKQLVEQSGNYDCSLHTKQKDCSICH